MQMYVNYYTRELMNEGDTPPIGIVLCADKSDAVVKYTLPEDNHQIFASKYQMLSVPKKEFFTKKSNYLCRNKTDAILQLRKNCEKSTNNPDKN